MAADGLCECGCGNPTYVPKWSDRSKGWKAGVPIRFIRGHHTHKAGTKHQRKRDTPRERARQLATKALRGGQLMREAACADCGGASEHMHHEDYARPLEVTWLCRDCHLERHGRRADGKCPRCGSARAPKARGYCRSCRAAVSREWRARNQEKVRAAQESWRERNPNYWRDRYQQQKQEVTAHGDR